MDWLVLVLERPSQSTDLNPFQNLDHKILNVSITYELCIGLTQRVSKHFNPETFLPLFLENNFLYKCKNDLI